ncbi:DgyrCDS5025 [Dimorphilus gyrociliatus]|uniref:peptidylprolyl isomerase n=1 Tax=Dimorphilus gyrociliatus TaxID=2664684 RepID=A0A7I8VII4_9ANNE|nr:DgyrCDS5025 [Dimorphilus gyrociliatus]
MENVAVKHMSGPEECSNKVDVGDVVSIHYTGKLKNGKLFDSSKERGEPLTFEIGARNVIPGMERGIIGMCIGATRVLTIPPHLAYGPNGHPPVIPPDSTLIFEVTLERKQQKNVVDKFMVSVFQFLKLISFPVFGVYIVYIVYKKYKREDEQRKESKRKMKQERKVEKKVEKKIKKK